MNELFFFNPHGIIKLSIGILSLVVGIFVLVQNPRSKAHQGFFLLSFFGAIWLSSFALMILAKDHAAAYKILGMGYLLGVPYISPSVYYFSLGWTQRAPKNKFLLPAGFASSLIFGVLIFLNPSYFCQLIDSWWGRYNLYKPGLGPTLYMSSLIFQFFFYAFLSFQNIWEAYKEAESPEQKSQLRVFMIGFFIGYSGLLDFAMTKGLDIYPVGFILYFLFLSLNFYNFIRHRFLNINLFRNKVLFIGLIYIWLGAVILPASIFIFHKAGLGILGGSIWPLISLSFIFGGIFSLAPFLFAFLTNQSFWLKTNETMGLAHEIKSPLSNLEAYQELLEDQANLPNEAKRYLERTRHNLNRIRSFSENLLELAKLETGRWKINKEMVTLEKLIRPIIDFQPDLEAKGIIFSSEIASSQFTLPCDTEKIQLVISNILSNAVKSMNKGEITLKISVQNGHAKFQVQDSGRGIPKDQISKIFKKFYQGTGKSKGSGIGLSIAKGWVEAHGGEIWAESEGEGKGTTVSFTIPV